MAEHIKTYTGLYFYPAAPDIESIRIRDIAHALSLLCRGNGQVTRFWSVGQHCICCAREAEARGYEDRLVLACLLHDASECYLSDVPSPLKKDLPAFEPYEERIMSLVFEKFLGSDLTAEEWKKVKTIDHELLDWDMEVLLGEPAEGGLPPMKKEPHYEVQPFEEVEQEYLRLFEEVSKRLQPSA